MLISTRIRTAVTAVAPIVAVLAAVAGPAAATTTAVTTYTQLVQAMNGPNCADGDTVAISANISAPTSVLTTGCTLTVDLGGNDVALRQILIGTSKTLTVKTTDEDGHGSLTADASGADGPGIRTTGATLAVESGEVAATGGSNGAGIGGGDGGHGGGVMIAGGIVTATGGSRGAGIGGGYTGVGGVNGTGGITISGGTVTAIGGQAGAGIGGGAAGAGGGLEISGGFVTATGSDDGAGIGGGWSGNGGGITISGGTVTATGGVDQGGQYGGAGIGGGGNAGDGGALVITVGADVTAIGGGTGSAVGSGSSGKFGGLHVAGLLRVPQGKFTIPNSSNFDEVHVTSTGRIVGTNADPAAGAQFSGAGSVANAGAITLSHSNVTGGAPGVTVRDRHYLVSFDTQGGSAAPAPASVFAKSFADGSRTFPTNPIKADFTFTGWNTVADGSGSAITATSSLPGTSDGTPVPVTAFAQWQTTTLCEGRVVTISGTAGPDFLFGTAGPDVIAGLGDKDEIDGAGGADFICGGDGDDLLTGGAGSDQLIGGPGTDRANYEASTGDVSANLTGGTGDDGSAEDGPVGSRDSIATDVELLNGGEGNDVLVGNSGLNRLDGLGGNDTLDGREGSDDLRGYDGIDTVTYASRSAAVTANLAGGIGDDGSNVDGAAGARDNIGADVERLVGGSGGDTLVGNSAANMLTGGVGNDALSGLAGNDRLVGGSGNDSVAGGTGADTLDGGAGVDYAKYHDHPLSVALSLDNKANDGNYTDGPAGARDNIWTTVESLIATKGADVLVGSAANNSLDGGLGADTFRGMGGNDYLKARDGARDRSLDGGTGTDSGQFDSVDPARVSVP